MKLAVFILSSISFLIKQYADKYQSEDFSSTLTELEQDRSLPRIQTYDFIVVGGGTGGCLIAGKLSQSFKVLLLEEGGSPVPQTYNPFLIPYISSHPSINSLFTSVPQHHFGQEGGQVMTSSFGKMLGGSGSHNGNVFNRGSPHDWDHFAQITGDESWQYKNVLKHFKKLENFVGKLVNENNREALYGTGGPITVDTELPPILNSWFQAGKELGFKTDDPNGNQSESFTPFAKSIYNGERVSTYTSFIKPFESTRENLTVLRYSQGQKIFINEDKVAYGVLYKRHGIPQIAHASKEVIISCGTISSPLLLMKSGVGPRDVLEKANIPVKHELPGVGQNLKDHGSVILEFTANNPNLTLLPLMPEDKIEDALIKYENRSGFFTNLNVQAQAFLVTSRAKTEGQGLWPDLQIVFEIKRKIGDEKGPQKIHMSTVLNRLKSVGEVSLNSKAFLEGEEDDTKLALIDHRLFSVESDVEALIDGINQSLKIIEETSPFQAMNITYTQTPPDSCKKFEFRSDDFWRCYIKERAKSWWHFTGTCKMGRDDDPMAVVDSKLRVRGIKNLRVVDASVMPQPTNANINAPTMLIAIKTAKEIKILHGAESQQGFGIDPFV